MNEAVWIRATGRMLARVITEALAPAVLVAGMSVLVGWHATGWRPVGLLWGTGAALFCSLLPFWYIVRRVQAGDLSDHHIGVRAQRRGPMLVGLGSIVLGLVLLALLGAPRHLIALVIAIFLGGTASTIFNSFWKMSVHTAVAAASVAGLVVEFGWWLTVTAPLAVLVGWSRVRLADHTVPQVLVGAVVGALVSGTAYALLR